MRILIIEDEKPAAQKLQKAIARKTNVELLGVLGSVEESVYWLEQNSHPDLIFMDIQLSDGISFKIFDRVQLSCPVIFTTAFDDYWQKAFEYNSIDYLLKPVKQDRLDIAL